jgi:hypothetical protein
MSNLVRIGYGDDVVEHWENGWEESISSLNELFEQAEEFSLSFEWHKIFPQNKGHLSFSNALNLLDELGILIVKRQNWGGDSPGRSGTFIKVYIEKGTIRAVKKAIANTTQLVTNYFELKGYDKVVLEKTADLWYKRYVDASKKIEDNLKIVHELEEKYKSLELRLNELNRTYEMVLSIVTKKGGYHCWGPILATPEKIYVIVKSEVFDNDVYGRYQPVIEKLRDLKIEFVEVLETSNQPKSHVMVQAMGGMWSRVGWGQTKTILSALNAASADINRVREEYLERNRIDK